MKLIKELLFVLTAVIETIFYSLISSLPIILFVVLGFSTLIISYEKLTNNSLDQDNQMGTVSLNKQQTVSTCKSKPFKVSELDPHKARTYSDALLRDQNQCHLPKLIRG